jgi:hypothetical protein
LWQPPATPLVGVQDRVTAPLLYWMLKVSPLDEAVMTVYPVAFPVALKR